MNTIDSTIKKLHPHWTLYFRFYLIGLIFVIGGIVAINFKYTLEGSGVIALGILISILGEVLRKAVTYYVLDSGVARGYNFLSTSRKFAEYGNIQNVAVYQSFVEKIFGIGSVSFDTSGSDVIEVYFDGVKRPYEIEEIVRGKMAIK